MKILKIILSIAVGIAVLVGIMLLVKNMTKISGGGTEEDQQVFTELKEEIEKDWKDMLQWNLSLYNEEMKKVTNAYSTEDISQRNLENLKTLIASNALVAIDKTLPKLMKAPQWDSEKINYEMGGIDSVAKIPALEGKEEVVRSRAVYSLYHQTSDWVGKTMRSGVGSYYTGSVTLWTNFNSIVSQTESRASQFRNSKYFKEFLSNKLDKSLANAVGHVTGLRQKYYDAVAQSIIRHYRIEDWSDYSDPLATFQRVQNDLTKTATKLKSENATAASAVDRYKLEFNKSRPKENSK